MKINLIADCVFPLCFIALFAWIIHAGNYKGLRLMLMVTASVIFTVGVLSALAGIALFPKPLVIAIGCFAVVWVVGVCIKREMKVKPNHPDWLIEKIQSDLKTVELTKDAVAVEGYKKELVELLKKHNIKPPADIQRLLTPATFQPHSADNQQ